MPRLRAPEYTLAHQASGWSRLVTPALLLAHFSYLVGILAPMLHIEKFWLFTESFSIVAGIGRLLANGEVLLALVIFLFSIVFPFWKLLTLHRLWRRADARGLAGDRRLAMLVQLGRWSMLDVQLVAILVALVKLGALVEAEAGPGLYWFALSVLLTMLIGHLVEKRAREPLPAPVA